MERAERMRRKRKTRYVNWTPGTVTIFCFRKVRRWSIWRAAHFSNRVHKMPSHRRIGSAQSGGSTRFTQMRESMSQMAQAEEFRKADAKKKTRNSAPQQFCIQVLGSSDQIEQQRQLGDRPNTALDDNGPEVTAGRGA